MDAASHVEVRVTQRYRAPADSVFDAWIDPVIAGRWLFATAWRPMSRVEIDARPGGAFRLTDQRGNKCSGKYLELARPRRLVFTLTEYGRPSDVTRVNVEIVQLAAGCELALTHENVAPDCASRAENRWTGMLYGLGETLKRRQES